MAFRFTPRQLEAQKFLTGPARHKLIFGGAPSGKTFVIVRRIVTRAVLAPRWALSELMLGDEFDAETYLKAWRR
jgi:hypothetical protein